MANPDGLGRCISVVPIMPTTDIARTRQHYERLGFTADVIDDFMMTKRDDIELFFSLSLEHDPKRTASCVYVRVADADTLHAHWQAADIPGLRQLRNTHYDMREFAYVDPDGNMILFGSRLSQRRLIGTVGPGDDVWGRDEAGNGPTGHILRQRSKNERQKGKRRHVCLVLRSDPARKAHHDRMFRRLVARCA
jgi:hypothetical protein